MSHFPLNSSPIVTTICAWKSSILRFYLLFVPGTRDREGISHLPICIFFGNTNTTSSDTILKLLICLIALRRYTEDSNLPIKSVSDFISIADVTNAEIILLLNGHGPIQSSSPMLSVLQIPMYFTCSLKLNLSSAITPRNFIALFDSILVPPTIT